MDTEKKEVLESLISYLERFVPGAKANVLKIRQGQMASAFRDLTDLVEGLEWIISAVHLLSDEWEPPIDVTVINEHLSETISSLENNDYVFLADLLEYEIIPIVEQWQEQIAV